jgi:hypothetical protein
MLRITEPMDQAADCSPSRGLGPGNGPDRRHDDLTIEYRHLLAQRLASREQGFKLGVASPPNGLTSVLLQ